MRTVNTILRNANAHCKITSGIYRIFKMVFVNIISVIFDHRSFEKVKEEAKEEKRLEKLKMEARLMQLREENEKEF
jgi:hypothetical protein